MGFLSNLIGGAVGFLTGGPAGAVAGLLGGGGGGGHAAAGGGAAPVTPVVNLNADPQTSAAGAEAFLRAYLQGREGGARPTVFDARQALAEPNPMQQRSNQQGGMSSVPGGDGGPFKPAVKGAGKGAGGNSPFGSLQDPLQPKAASPSPAAVENGWWRQAFAGTQYANQGRYSGPLNAGFRSYMQNALAGRDGLPQAAYDAALQQGMHTINAQAQQSNQQLQEALGARGLAHSGMMGSGMLGIEQNRLGAFGQLATGLAQQGLQASREAQQNAAAMFPALLGADTQASSDAWHGLLAQRQLELEARRLGISQQQIDDAQRTGNYDALAGLVGAAAQYFGGSSNTGSGTSPNILYAGGGLYT